MSWQPIVPLLSFDEFVTVYEHGEVRHEFVDGFVRAMAGGTRAHHVLTGRVARLLFDAAAAAGCTTFTEGRRLDIGGAVGTPPRRSYYPDVMVVCAPAADDSPAEREPCLVVEVLSDSTAAIDQIEKLAAYEAVPSILAYLIVSQSERRVIVHRRTPDGFRAAVHGPGATIELQCPELTLTVDEIYADLERQSAATTS